MTLEEEVSRMPNGLYAVKDGKLYQITVNVDGQYNFPILMPSIDGYKEVQFKTEPIDNDIQHVSYTDEQLGREK